MSDYTTVRVRKVTRDRLVAVGNELAGLRVNMDAAACAALDAWEAKQERGG